MESVDHSLTLSQQFSQSIIRIDGLIGKGKSKSTRSSSSILFPQFCVFFLDDLCVNMCLSSQLVFWWVSLSAVIFVHLVKLTVARAIPPFLVRFWLEGYSHAYCFEVLNFWTNEYLKNWLNFKFNAASHASINNIKSWWHFFYISEAFWLLRCYHLCYWIEVIYKYKNDKQNSVYSRSI